MIPSCFTGVKKESRLPKICDERPDTSVKIIVLDLRTNSDPNKANENVPASKFKKMPKEIWDNVLQIGRAFKPNQSTDCPIQTSPPTTIDVYANILPKNPPSQQFMRQQQQQQQQMPMAAHQINPYNNAGMFHPGMMYGNMMPPNGANPMMFNQPNYMNVMAAAQSIVNAATAYNNMFLPSFNPHPIMSPQPQHLMSPQPQHIMSPQHQHAQLVQQQQQQQQPNTQIKRKPVQLHQPTSYLSPQIEQRLLRKKSLPYQQQHPQQQQQQQQHYMNIPDPYQQPQFEPAKPKKRVRFAPNHTLYVYERFEGEDEAQGTVGGGGGEEDEHGQEYQQDGDYHHENEPHYYQDYDDNDINDNEHHHDPYYTQQQQQQPFNNNNPYQSNRLPPPLPQQQQQQQQQQPYRNNDHRYYYHHQNEPVDAFDDGEVEEEDLGDLWKRRSFIQRHNSKYRSRA